MVLQKVAVLEQKKAEKKDGWKEKIQVASMGTTMVEPLGKLKEE